MCTDKFSISESNKFSNTDKEIAVIVEGQGLLEKSWAREQSE